MACVQVVQELIQASGSNDWADAHEQVRLEPAMTAL